MSNSNNAVKSSFLVLTKTGAKNPVKIVGQEPVTGAFLPLTSHVRSLGTKVQVRLLQEQGQAEKPALMADLLPEKEAKEDKSSVVSYDHLQDSIQEIMDDVDNGDVKIYKGKWAQNLVSFEGDQRCEVMALVIASLESDIVLTGETFNIYDCNPDAYMNKALSGFWGKWFNLHLTRLNAFFKDGTRDKYVDSIVYALISDNCAIERFKG